MVERPLEADAFWDGESPADKALFFLGRIHANLYFLLGERELLHLIEEPHQRFDIPERGNGDSLSARKPVIGLRLMGSSIEAKGMSGVSEDVEPILVWCVADWLDISLCSRLAKAHGIFVEFSLFFVGILTLILVLLLMLPAHSGTKPSASKRVLGLPQKRGFRHPISNLALLSVLGWNLSGRSKSSSARWVVARS